MAEFNFKSKKNEIRLSVRKDDEEIKELVFDCSPTNYRFIKRAAEAGKAIDGAIKAGLTVDHIDEIVKAERDAFEVMAPGRWEEFFDYLEEDVGNMAQLVKVMLETVRKKGIEAKTDSIAPAVPDGEQV